LVLISGQGRKNVSAVKRLEMTILPNTAFSPSPKIPLAVGIPTYRLWHSHPPLKTTIETKQSKKQILRGRYPASKLSKFVERKNTLEKFSLLHKIYLVSGYFADILFSFSTGTQAKIQV
jgi:hypothetical protein